MGTEEADFARVSTELGSSSWIEVVSAVRQAESCLRAAMPGDPKAEQMIGVILNLFAHDKWEVRRAVAGIAGQFVHSAFDAPLAALSLDDNDRVRLAAIQAVARRRDLRRTSSFGKQHEERLNDALDDIELRVGVRGREAVRRASEQLANTFARELYHEAIKVLTPLAMSAEKLTKLAREPTTTREQIAVEADRIEKRVTRLTGVLNGMKKYAEIPVLKFEDISVRSLVAEAVSLVTDRGSETESAPVTMEVDEGIAVVGSYSRLLQAVTNLLTNALEAYEGLSGRGPVIVSVEASNGAIVIAVRDYGCGMSREGLDEAKVLFATSKVGGTGYGLPLAIKIIESEHNGRFELESMEGKGTIARIILPARQTGAMSE